LLHVLQGQLLDPVDVTAAYKNDGIKRDIAVNVTDLALHVSPDVVTIISKVSETILKPIQAASSSQPLYAISKYSRLAMSHCKRSAAPPYASVGSGGLDGLGDERGFTFWEPIAPPGHCILGHVLTAGTAQPTHEVMCVALASGIVAWPLGFQKVWNGGTAVVWEALPPDGYTAIGCLVTTGDQPPWLNSMVCVHSAVLVQARIGECLARSGEGSLWTVDNAAGCFIFAEVQGAIAAPACAVIGDRSTIDSLFEMHGLGTSPNDDSILDLPPDQVPDL
jgi:vacuolar protein sorting-associated protein 13A/C